MDINAVPPWILEQILRGNAILFLGAGAAYDSVLNGSPIRIGGEQLRDLLSDEFLNGEEKEKSLVQVADYAKHQAGLEAVQVFIKSQFYEAHPASFHKLIPLFKWSSIFTTNYDLIVERAYDSQPLRMQTLAPVLGDGDDFQEALQDPSKVPYFKLHGCISDISNSALPLILASEEYAKHKKNRSNLFSHFHDFGLRKPIIFCGYKVGDSNLQTILFDLFDHDFKRPGYVVVDPGINRYEEDIWRSHRITPIKETFKDFIETLDSNIDRQKRVLSLVIPQESKSYSNLLAKGASLSTNLVQYLDVEMEHIIQGMPNSTVHARDFYKGVDCDWSGIAAELDIKRSVSDRIIVDATFDNSNVGLKSFLLLGHAGSGKSISLKRAAWDAANLLDAQVFFLKKGGVVRPELITELASASTERLLVFIDDAMDQIVELSRLFDSASLSDVEISIITSARENEWNQMGERLDGYIDSKYELNKLSHHEVDVLLEKLSANNSLGPLGDFDSDQLKQKFWVNLDRQLLVALHEATEGKPFEDIVYDEYLRVTPTEAQLLYADVCTLNRFGVPVRAGLISRISGIDIEDFNREFLGPLSQVVSAHMDSRSRDYVYTARHPIIAEFVFERAYENPSEKAQQIIRVLRHLNIDYSSDNDAFGFLIRGNNLADTFGDKSLVENIYSVASESGAPLSYVYHQRAVFELRHSGSDLRAALSYIQEAEKNLQVGSSNKAIAHTKANIYKSMAKQSGVSLEKDKYRAESRVILERLIRNNRDSRSYNTLIGLSLDEFDERSGLSDEEQYSDIEQRAITKIVANIERLISEGLQKYPDDANIRLSQARLARKLHQDEKVTSLLERAYRENNANEYIATSLARHRTKLGEIDSAIAVLRGTIARIPNSKAAHLQLAMLLIENNSQSNQEQTIYHLKRSFSPGDSNYEAQFWFARQNYLYGDRNLAHKLFQSLKKARVDPRLKNRIRGTLMGENEAGKRRFNGTIAADHSSFFFIYCTELKDQVFAHQSVFSNSAQLAEIVVGESYSFALGFTMKGPVAIDVESV